MSPIDEALLETAVSKVAGALPPPLGGLAPGLVGLVFDVYRQLARGTPPEEVKMAPMPDHMAIVAQLLAGDAPTVAP